LSSTAAIESAGCNINLNELQPGLNILKDWTGTRADVEEDTDGCFRMKIDTELFEGEQLFALRGKDPASNGKYHEGLFENKKRTYVYQLQGRFKRQPRGPILLQACAIDDEASLGMITRGVVKAWFKFAESYVPSLQLRTEPGPNRPIGGSVAVDPSWLAILKTPAG